MIKPNVILLFFTLLLLLCSCKQASKKSIALKSGPITFKDKIMPVPENTGLKMDGYYIWGGSLIKVGKTWHLFASRWPNKNEFAKDYREMSEIVRATSNNPLGPYKFQEVVIGERDSLYWDSNMAHNPTIHKIGDTFVLFYIGSDFTTYLNGSPNKLRRIGYATAKNITGPWYRSKQPVINSESNNPAVIIENNNEVLMMFRDEKLQISVAKAPVYNGIYQVLNDNVWPDARLEDFYLFKTGNKYHCICEDNEGAVTGHIRWGAHLVSEDGINNWGKYTDHIVYDHTLKLEKGKSLDCVRRERPQLYIEDNKIHYLITSVYDGKNTWCQPVPVIPPVNLN